MIDPAKEHFEPEPSTQAEYVKSTWYRLGRVEAMVAKTNGRVRQLEKFMWAMGGGLTVTVLIIVPQMLEAFK